MPLPSSVPGPVGRLGRGIKQVGGLIVGNDQTAVGNPSPAAIKRIETGTKTVDPASINAATVGETSVTITGTAVGDLVVFIPPATIEANLVIGAAYVSAANTVKLRIGNPTAAPIDPASATWSYVWIDLT